MKELILGGILAAALYLIWKKEGGKAPISFPGSSRAGEGTNRGSVGGGHSAGGCGGSCLGAASPAAQSEMTTGPVTPNAAVTAQGQGTVSPAAAGPLGGAGGSPKATSYNPAPTATSQQSYAISVPSSRAGRANPRSNGFHIIRNPAPGAANAPGAQSVRATA